MSRRDPVLIEALAAREVSKRVERAIIASKSWVNVGAILYEKPYRVPVRQKGSKS